MIATWSGNSIELYDSDNFTFLKTAKEYEKQLERHTPKK